MFPALQFKFVLMFGTVGEDLRQSGQGDGAAHRILKPSKRRIMRVTGRQFALQPCLSREADDELMKTKLLSRPKAEHRLALLPEGHGLSVGALDSETSGAYGRHLIYNRR
jgi:hypothetical protein